VRQPSRIGGINSSVSTTHAQLTDSQTREAERWLHLAARAGLRAFGNAEPNPMVGCVIVKENQLLAIGHHRNFGGLHAERDALARCNELGHDPTGATAYVTLEPCCHHGKQPPCTDALIEAGIARVIAARPDPAEESRGGFEILNDAGIETVFCDADPLAVSLADPFVHRLSTGQPWVIAKWAQTLDGKVATRTGQSQWISGPECRHRVHQLRGRVDAILTGIGTVLADDPMLNARTRQPRRVARRVVVDTTLRTPTDCNLVRTAGEIPVTIYAGVDENPKIEELTSRGVEVVEGPGVRPELRGVLEDLHTRHKVSTVLVEAGPTLLGAMLEADLIDQAVVHLAPMVVGDARARGAAEGRDVPEFSMAKRFVLQRSRRAGADIELTYTRDRTS
jgi:diaminohydroxyphosphoribosylaminopyrimidine deaminase/5-amino-6-(5-phosphoribosylamino)uracil reductase